MMLIKIMRWIYYSVGDKPQRCGYILNRQVAPRVPTSCHLAQLCQEALPAFQIVFAVVLGFQFQQLISYATYRF